MLTTSFDQTGAFISDSVECPECGKTIYFDPASYDEHLVGKSDFECPHCKMEIVILGKVTIDYSAWKKEG